MEYNFGAIIAETIVMGLLKMSLVAGAAILIVIAVRHFLKKAPKVFSYALWGIVLFRLLCPVSVGAPFSVYNLGRIAARTAGIEMIQQGLPGNSYRADNAENLPGQADTNPADTDSADGSSDQMNGNLPAGGLTEGNASANGLPEGNAGANGQLAGNASTNGQLAANAGASNTGAASALTEHDPSLGKIEGMYAVEQPVTPEEFVPGAAEGANAVGNLTAGAPEDMTAAGSRNSTGFVYAFFIWLAGMLLLYGSNVFALMKLRRCTAQSLRIRDNIYISDEVTTPFCLGIVRPKIYLPSGLAEAEREYVIIHEQTHIRRLDHIIKLLAFIALGIHWFNPLVWAAFVLAGKDMEMSCDEAVIGRMGSEIRAAYSASLLGLATGRRIVTASPLAFGEGDPAGRIRNVMDYKKPGKGVVIAAIVVCVLAGLVLLTDSFEAKADDVTTELSEKEGAVAEQGEEEMGKPEEEAHEPLTIDLAQYYITSTGDPSNFYLVDGDHILWGSGYNECGQLGQGIQNQVFHEEPVKIAENVIHVDYSQRGFMIYLTYDHKLYGVGNAGTGVLGQYDSFDWNRYLNGEQYSVSTPVLIAENVSYARCGRDDIVYLTDNGQVWTLGTVAINGGFGSSDVLFYKDPVKILDDAVYVSGGWFNHAALTSDASLWTWGYNSAGNCGVEDPLIVREPIPVAEDVEMVWTGSTELNDRCEKIADYNGVYKRWFNNTVIQKRDGALYICGENVGTAERTVHAAEASYTAVCSYEFLPYENLYEKMAGEYWFLSGAGGWQTRLNISSDGTFEGLFEDSNAGSLERCEFKGELDFPVKIRDYTYKARICSMEYAAPEESHVDNGITITNSTPYGLTEAEEILIYTPGYEMSAVTEEEYSWIAPEREEFWHLSREEAAGTRLPCYAIVSKADGTVFTEVPKPYRTNVTKNTAAVTLWDSLKHRTHDTQRKWTAGEDNTFEEEYVAGYVRAAFGGKKEAPAKELIPVPETLIRAPEFTLREYRLSDTVSVFAAEQRFEKGRAVTCIYYDSDDADAYETTQIDLPGKFPKENAGDMQILIVDGSDGTVKSYAAIGEGIYDSGSRFYDLDERLLLWTRNVTDSSRHAFLVWEEGRVAMIIDTGGSSYSIGPDDVESGIQTYIYRFDEPVEFEDLLLY